MHLQIHNNSSLVNGSFGMINRRLLRIKVLQELYAHLYAEDRSLEASEKELQLSIQRSYDLYYYLILLLVEVRNYARHKIEQAKEKLIPAWDDLHPNTRFIDNAIIVQIDDNPFLQKYVSDHKIGWSNYPELIRHTYIDLTQTELFKNYMASPTGGYETDKTFAISLFTDFFQNSEMLAQHLEEQSIFWNDEVDYVFSMIVKSIHSFTEEKGSTTPLMKMYRNEEDKSFGSLLLHKTILNRDEYLSLVDQFCKNWDLERIAFIDKLILILAISEAIEFPFIPTRVTMNEYIDIAKLYSTQQSGTFVNGLLDKIFQYLKDQNRIVKKGKGLIGEL
ncbi:MAG: transcription antitermination factor NusB [Candidatus Atribacteria bacterium]|nr:transcription antitermination factor NusB [Candidatus Atribacteria bacterium]